MYKCRLTPEALSQLVNLAKPKLKTNLVKRITKLYADPYITAKRTNKSIFGEYYYNLGGYYAMTFDIDEKEGKMNVIMIIPRARLYRMLLNKNSPQ